MKFLTALSALEWAEMIISIREGGRTSAAMMEFVGGGAGKDYAILDAYQIRIESEKACAAGSPCPYQRPRCMYFVLLPDPLVQYPERSDSEKQRHDDCLSEFERRLREKGYLYD